MKKLLFRLDGVPEDEAADIRLLLSENEIPFYETPGGKWGVSVAAIWVEEGDEYARAKPVLDEYAKMRSVSVREEYARLMQEGKVETIFDRAVQRPIAFIGYLAFALVIIYITIMPFLWFL